MAKREYFKTVGGSSLIPVADGDFYTDLMSADYSQAEQQDITFYSDAEGKIPVTATAGTVTVTGTSDDFCYRTINQGVFDAADACLASRARPNAIGCMVRAKLSLSGVTGATYFSAVIWRA